MIPEVWHPRLKGVIVIPPALKKMLLPARRMPLRSPVCGVGRKGFSSESPKYLSPGCRGGTAVATYCFSAPRTVRRSGHTDPGWRIPASRP